MAAGRHNNPIIYFFSYLVIKKIFWFIWALLPLTACTTFNERSERDQINAPQGAQTNPRNLDQLFPKFEFALPTDPDLIRSVRPIDKFANVPREEIPDLLSRIQTGFAMSDLNSIQVDRFIDQYAKQSALERIVLRGQYFLYDIVVELEKRKMPTELALLPIVESSFNTQAVSHASAVGVWQFISSTALRFGLKQSPWIDERQLTLKATAAALDYLQWLYNQFGNWHLALAAYNCGEACVGRALKSVGWPDNRQITYDDLPIPRETQQYAPRLQALKEIFADPEKYGLKLPILPNSAQIKALKVEVPINFEMIAKLADSSLDEIKFLNAHLRQGIYHPNLNTDLLLSEDSVETFLSNLVNYNELGNKWIVHRVNNKGTLANVASLYHADLEVVRTANPKHLSGVAPHHLIIVPIDGDNGATNAFNTVSSLPVIAMPKSPQKGKRVAKPFAQKKQLAQAKKPKNLLQKKLALREKYTPPKPLKPEELKKLKKAKVAIVKVTPAKNPAPKTNIKATAKTPTQASALPRPKGASPNQPKNSTKPIKK